MERKQVSSSNIRSVGYEPETRILEVEFHGGRVYQYSGVAEGVHRNLMLADSKGSFFSTHIRDRYPTKRVK